MNVGLLDVDGHNFPNLALMKLSAYHKQRGDSVEFADMFGAYDILYKSKVFTFTEDNNYCYNAKSEIIGGSGYGIYAGLEKEVESVYPDYSLYGCRSAYGFLTRGCIRSCKWCVVPLAEGKIHPASTIDEVVGNMGSAVLMDNNVLAHEHGIRQLERIVQLGVKVDFNQGLDYRLIDDFTARMLSKIKWLSPVRLACDTSESMPGIERAVKLLRKYNCTPSNYFCYVLVRDIESAFSRVEFLRSLKVDPFAQAYRPIDDSFTPTQEQKQFCRWVNHKAIFKSVRWEDYKKTA